MKRCHCCGTMHTRADQLSGVWGFQTFNGYPGVDPLGFYDCANKDCTNTLVVDLPNPEIKEPEDAHA